MNRLIVAMAPATR